MHVSSLHGARGRPNKSLGREEEIGDSWGYTSGGGVVKGGSAALFSSSFLTRNYIQDKAVPGRLQSG